MPTAQNARRGKAEGSGVALSRRRIAATSNFDTSKPPILSTRLPEFVLLSPVYFQTHYQVSEWLPSRYETTSFPMRAHTQTDTRLRRGGTQTHSGLMSLEEQIEHFENIGEQIKRRQEKMEVPFHTLFFSVLFFVSAPTREDGGTLSHTHTLTYSHTNARARAHTHTHTWCTHACMHARTHARTHALACNQHAHTSQSHATGKYFKACFVAQPWAT